MSGLTKCKSYVPSTNSESGGKTFFLPTIFINPAYMLLDYEKKGASGRYTLYSLGGLRCAGHLEYPIGYREIMPRFSCLWKLIPLLKVWIGNLDHKVIRCSGI